MPLYLSHSCSLSTTLCPDHVISIKSDDLLGAKALEALKLLTANWLFVDLSSIGITMICDSMTMACRRWTHKQTTKQSTLGKKSVRTNQVGVDQELFEVCRPFCLTNVGETEEPNATAPTTTSKLNQQFGWGKTGHTRQGFRETRCWRSSGEELQELRAKEE